MNSANDERPDAQPEPVVIRDKRRIDPATGEARRPDADSGAAAAVPEASHAEVQLASELAERTADLQRLQAEFANYRKRVERDRVSVRENAVGDVLAALLPVIDDIDRARAHGDLTGGLKAVADQFDTVLTKLGLVAFGEAGDPFDPALHEAVMHDESDQVQISTASNVMRKGYRHGDRLLRPALVAVTDPIRPADAESADGASEHGDA
ncbi:MAG: nucleotide exchange factor GrpE [Actinobacteria bacterium]|nr:nucleotide exchange factor GrpE [Actinomycetota bacterium]